MSTFAVEQKVRCMIAEKNWLRRCGAELKRTGMKETENTHSDAALCME
jgi:hypothetical protein